MSAARQPKWQRLGFATDSDYRAACSAKKKTQRAALAASSATYTTFHILRIMWDRADYHAPRVTITKEQIMREARCSLKTVKVALQTLRAEGSVKPVAGIKGGRRVATTYRLQVVGGGKNAAQEHVEATEAERDRNTRFKFLAQKYGAIKAMEILDREEQDA